MDLITSLVACFAQFFFARRLRLLSMNFYLCFVIAAVCLFVQQRLFNSRFPLDCISPTYCSYRWCRSGKVINFEFLKTPAVNVTQGLGIQSKGEWSIIDL